MRSRAFLIVTGLLVAFCAGDPATASPPNDDRADATTISALPFEAVQDLAGSTAESGEWSLCLPPWGISPLPPTTRTAWYRYRPTEFGRLQAGVSSSSGEAILSVFAEDSRGNFFYEDCGHPVHDGSSRVAFRSFPQYTLYFQVSLSATDLGSTARFWLDRAPSADVAVSGLTVTEVMQTPAGAIPVTNARDIDFTLERRSGDVDIAWWQVFICPGRAHASQRCDLEIEGTASFGTATSASVQAQWLGRAGDYTICAVSRQIAHLDTDHADDALGVPTTVVTSIGGGGIEDPAVNSFMMGCRAWDFW